MLFSYWHSSKVLNEFSRIISTIVSLGLSLLIPIMMMMYTHFMFCRDGVAIDRIVGFEELGGKDNFAPSALLSRLKKQGGNK